MFREKKVFITGATSFIGSHLVRRLVSEGADVHVLIRSSKNLYRLRDVSSSLKCWKGDIRDRVALKKLMKRLSPQVIFHLASFGVRPGQSDLSKLAEINIQGLVNILSSLEERDFEYFIYSGTSAEYGPSGIPMAENQVLNPVTLYGATKAAGTLLTQAFGRFHHKKVLVLRPFYVYGPDEGPARFVSTVIRTGLAGRQLKLTALSEKRDFIYVDDVIDAYILATTKNLGTHTVLNIGTGKEYRLKD
ncbi:MAG: NAD-dependent epimerase/dehydratase family protein, partial [Candidatus Omnitrophica bacterium]|nr:NAD-dependent epimerase/dehydratase family protein [Candidatus Omnitrophota bacterium]